MTYALIGTGNMAWLMASRMMAAGHTCTGVWGRNSQATEALCSNFHLPRLNSLSQLHDGVDACILAVSDDAIPMVIKELAFRSTTLIHTAGSVPIQVLENNCLNAGVVWPVFAIRKNELPTHRQFATIIEGGTKQALFVVQAVAKALSDINYETNTPKRQALHLAAVIGSNFTNYLLATSMEMCEAQGLPVSLLQPLLFQTFTATRNRNPADLQTGPARRHDMETMNAHLRMLSKYPEHVEDLYKVLSKAIMDKYPLPLKA